MRRKLITSFIFLLALACVTDSYGQRKYGYKKSKSKKYSKYSGGRTSYSGAGKTEYWTVGASMNLMNYYGDLSPSEGRFSTNYGDTKFGFGVTVSRLVYPGIFVRAGYNMGTIQGDDFENGTASSEDASQRGRYLRNLHFKNTIHELAVGFEVDLIPNNGGARGRLPINPYMFVGVAVFAHNPKAKASEFDQEGNAIAEAGQWVELRKLGTEGQNISGEGADPYKKISFAIPIAGGLKVKLHHNLDLNVEIGFRKLFTDYIDDVSGAYVDLDSFGEDNLARAMSERGAEFTSALTGATRDINQDVNDPNGNPDISTQGPYIVGSGYDPSSGNSRGGPDFNDLYITTQFRLVYVFDKKGVSRGKFR